MSMRGFRIAWPQSVDEHVKCLFLNSLGAHANAPDKARKSSGLRVSLMTAFESKQIEVWTADIRRKGVIHTFVMRKLITPLGAV
jgi:hypothetical protein